MLSEKQAYYNEKNDTFYINSDLMLPNTIGMSFKEHKKAFMDAFKLSYEDRLKKFCPAETRKLIQQELKKHKGCEVSEFSFV